MENFKSVPGPVMCTRSVFDINSTSGSQAFAIFA